jgi:zinc/manganese transport system permease protein
MSLLRSLFQFQFMVNAFRAGTIVAILAGLMGWFTVLRRSTFAGHTLAVVGFPGAAGATLLGLPTSLGFFASCEAAAVVMAVLPHRVGSNSRSEESAMIGTVQALLLALGFLFVTLYRGNLNGLDALLFGSFLGITSGQVLVLAAVAAGCLAALAAIGRPLFFASAHPDVASAGGVPVRALSVAFLLLLAASVAEAAQITGALLVFALLVLPPATAHALTSRPIAGPAISVGVALAATWAGLAIAYYTPYPTGVFVTSLAFGAYLVARLWARARR